MVDAADVQGVVFKDGSVTLLARVVGSNGNPITRASLASARYSAYLLDENDPDAETPVLGHGDVEVEVDSLVTDSLQNDALWDVDTVGYNFKHVLDVGTQQVFTIAGRTYRIRFELTPPSGQVILVRFRTYVI